MPEEILPSIYRIEVPLPKNPLKYINSYLVKTRDRCLLIDTGLNRPECLDALRGGLAELDVDMHSTDIFITHLHSDHSGLAAVLKTSASNVFSSKIDGDAINALCKAEGHWDKMASGARHHGFDPEQLEAAITQHPGNLYGNKDWIDFRFVGEGDVLSYGEFHFHCIFAPGHTAGHLCLFEPKRGILVAGDNILNDITPNITAWSDSQNPLADYFATLDKLEQLGMGTVLPAHRRQITDWRERVSELRKHHQMRLAEVETILRQGEFTAYQVAAKMMWDIRCDSFAQFPVQQKWFATGEAIAHIRWLEDAGRIRRTSNQPVARFSA